VSGNDSEKQQDALDDKLDLIGWGLFLIWIGIAFWLDVGIGVGLIGVGAIILGEQVSRRFLGLCVEGFWITVGLLMVLSGVWQAYDVNMPLGSGILVLLGLIMVATALTGKRVGRRHRMK
jgi:hypothetical protein